MKTQPFGYLQRQMIGFMRQQIELYGFAIDRAFHIQCDRDSRRVASSLELRGVIRVDRAYDMWLVRPNYEHPMFSSLSTSQL